MSKVETSPPPTFAKGDAVRVITTGIVGKIDMVVTDTNRPYRVKWIVANYCGCADFFTASEIESITEGK